MELVVHPLERVLQVPTGANLLETLRDGRDRVVGGDGEVLERTRVAGGVEALGGVEPRQARRDDRRDAGPLRRAGPGRLAGGSAFRLAAATRSRAAAHSVGPFGRGNEEAHLRGGALPVRSGGGAPRWFSDRPAAGAAGPGHRGISGGSASRRG